MDNASLLAACPMCKGAGKIQSNNSRKIKCQTCGGAGKIDFRTADEDLQMKIAVQYAS